MDYRRFNKLTVKYQFPIPVIDKLLVKMHDSKYYSKLYLKAGYHHIRMCKQDIYKIAFEAYNRHFEFKVMSFGLCNAPATVQCLMNRIFHNQL